MEYEKKALLKNKDRLLSYLNTNGFLEPLHNHQIDTYFFPDGVSFKGRYLRVRSSDKKSSVDFHIVHDNTATEEFESRIEKPEILIHILKSIGLKILCIVNKKRQTYQLGNVKIMLDEVENLGNFVEIEVNVDNQQEAEEIINNIFTEIGVQDSDVVKGKGYPDLIVGGNNGI